MSAAQFARDFSTLINAGFPYVYISSYEEDRVTEAIETVLKNREYVKTERGLYVWTQTQGLVRCGGKPEGDTAQPANAVEWILKSEEPAVYLMKDVHVFFGADRNARPDVYLIRRFRDVADHLKTSRKTVVFLSPRLVIPQDMEKEISILDFSLPDANEIRALLDRIVGDIAPGSVHLTEDEKALLAKSALGLTMQEAENAFYRAIVYRHGLDAGAVSIIHEEKNQVVKKTGVLEFVKTDLGIDDIGGLENLKGWLRRRNGSWGERAKAYCLPAPKGVLITGVPGCGKSLTAKAMSAAWGLPLLKLDMGRIFGSLVGSSEENMRKAISTAEAVSPSILWVDEIEKGFSGTKSGGDSGASARVFGTFLTWLQEKTKPVFVIATANDISALPPELLRKGRFDETFFVDLPTTAERKKIFQLHLAKRVRPGAVDHRVSPDDDALLNELAALSAGYSGAEIEQCVVSAMFDAFFAERGLTDADLTKAIRDTVPLSTTQKEQIAELRAWAAERAVPATAQADEEKTAASAGAAPVPASRRRVDYTG